MRTKEEIIAEQEKLTKEIKVLEGQIGELEVQADELRDRRYELDLELSRVSLAGDTIALLNGVYEVTADNSQVEKLDNSTKTIPIMSRFIKSGRRFLIFSNAFSLGKQLHKVSLVITRSCTRINYNFNGLVMTDLKNAVGIYLTDYNLKSKRPESRLYPLYSELVAIGKRELMKGQLIPFETPCMIGGQTYGDRTGFGWEYCGETLVRQGKEYGETTKFLIIGIRVES